MDETAKDSLCDPSLFSKTPGGEPRWSIRLSRAQVQGGFDDAALTAKEIASKIHAGELCWLDWAMPVGKENGSDARPDSVCFPVTTWQVLIQISEIRQAARVPAQDDSARAEVLEGNSGVFIDANRLWALGKRVSSLQGDSYSVVGMVGPLNLAEARQKVFAGEFSFSDMAWQPGLAAWMPIRDLEAFDRDVVIKASGGPEILDGEVAKGSSLPMNSAKDSAEGAEAILQSLVFQKDLREKKLNQNSNSKAESALLPLDSESPPPEATGEDLLTTPDWMRLIKKAQRYLPLLISVGLMQLIASYSMAASQLHIRVLQKAKTAPLLVFETDAAATESLTVIVRGESGQILSLPSYRRTLTVERQENELPSLALGDLNLPNGTYQIEASAGAVRAEASVFVGENDGQFAAELKRHQKKISILQQQEKKILFYGSQTALHLIEDWDGFWSSSSQASQKQKAWGAFYALWEKRLSKVSEGLLAAGKTRADLVPASKSMPAFGDLAFPEKFQELTALLQQLGEESKKLDSVLRAPGWASRRVASHLGFDTKLKEGVKALNQESATLSGFSQMDK